MERKHFDPQFEAERIVQMHIAGYMSGAEFATEILDELYDTMIEECSFILFNEWKNGNYSPLEANMVRNELASLIYKLCYPAQIVEKEI